MSWSCRSRCIEYMHHFGGPIPIQSLRGSEAGAATAVRMATLDDIREAFERVDFKRAGVIDSTGVLLAAEVRGARVRVWLHRSHSVCWLVG